ncbi:MAG: hypothetical protein BWY61_01055 [Firmicutes bacterium ADurb.Bin354]|nr:MAG: hypothetical protein BWY61_01055 [Firmicutes bacterium ADurb.Bin354]
MSTVPLFYTSLVAFPSSEPCSITLFPTYKTDISVALIKKDLNKLLAVLRLVFVNRTYIVGRINSCFIDICTCLRIDDTEELSKINTVIVTCLDSRSHLGIGRVTDDDTVASCSTKLFYRSSNLLGYVALINILNLNSESIRCFIYDHLTL